MESNTFKSEDYLIKEEPNYHPVRDEIEVFESAYKNQLQFYLKALQGAVKQDLWSI